MALSLKPLAAWLPWRSAAPHADELYGAIVAQARLPVFYQGFGVPDTLEGRFVALSLHLFAVLHRLKQETSTEAGRLAQALSDRFTADMETVLRELGVSDMAIPKRMRKLAAAGGAQVQEFEVALPEGETRLARAIAAALPGENAAAEAAAARLAPYVMEVVRHLEAEPIQDLYAGSFRFPEISNDSRGSNL
jgi:cytochrome b pre-mRNA-processing protein 3